MIAKAVRPSDVEIEITASMPLKDWQAVSKTLRVSGSAWTETQYGRFVDKAIDALTKQWESTQEPTE
jgi:hypothetical protein